MGKPITADTYVETVMGDLAARHMLGELGPAITVYEAASLFRKFDHKRRALHPKDTLRALLSMAGAGYLVRVSGVGSSARFGLPPCEREPLVCDVVNGRMVSVRRVDPAPP